MNKDKSNYEKRDKFGRWVLVRRLGSGGNGEVWRAENEKSKIAAIKLLRKNKLSIKAYQRFRDEVSAVIKNSDVGGILPVLDSCLPEDLSSQTPWYVMPVATPIEKYLRGKNVQEIVISIVSIARTLGQLHERGVSHRDIKPSNLFHYKGAPCIGDFGLVDYPGKKDVTARQEAIGPRWTIAPEMRRRGATAAGPPADSYSLAKTLWIFLTGQRTGFDGQYNSASDSNINIERYHPTIYAKPLHDLLYECTDNDPSKRLRLDDFANRLESWISLNEEFRERNPVQWKDLERELFPAGLPTRAIWDRRDDVVAVLERIAAAGNLGHMFFPTGGGLHLDCVRESSEENCIELSGGGHPYIVKPRRLIFDSFGSDSTWNYFRLETHELEILGQYDFDFHSKQEDLTEIAEGQYTYPEAVVFDDFDGERLPDTARSVTRILEGDFVIFSVISPYNLDSTTYDGRHNMMNADQFREYIGEHASASEAPTPVKNRPKVKFVRPLKRRHSTRKLTQREIDLLNNVILMARERRNEDVELHERYGLDPVVTSSKDKNLPKYLSAPRPKDQDLSKFLKRLTPADLVLVAAVMYAGRDFIVQGRARPLDEMIEYNRKSSDLIYSIREKSPLAEYITAGIEAYTVIGE